MEDPLKVYNDVLKISGGENIDREIYGLLEHTKEEGGFTPSKYAKSYPVDSDRLRTIKDAELLGLVVVYDDVVSITPEGLATLDRYTRGNTFIDRYDIMGTPVYGEAVANEIKAGYKEEDYGEWLEETSDGDGVIWSNGRPYRGWRDLEQNDNSAFRTGYNDWLDSLEKDGIHTGSYESYGDGKLRHEDWVKYMDFAWDGKHYCKACGKNITRLNDFQKQDHFDLHKNAGESKANEVEIDEYDKDDIFEFLFDLRDSGVTNMFGSGSYVKEEFPLLTRKQVQEVVLEWMNNFEELRQRMGYESYASEDWYDVPDMGDYKPEVMKWNLVFVDDGSDWGYQTNNKAEAERQVEEWNKDDASMTGRPIKMINQWEETAYYGESYANEETEYTGGDFCAKCGTEFEDRGECKVCNATETIMDDYLASSDNTTGITREDTSKSWWDNFAYPSQKANILNKTGSPVENTLNLPNYDSLPEQTKTYLNTRADFSYESYASEYEDPIYEFNCSICGFNGIEENNNDLLENHYRDTHNITWDNNPQQLSNAMRYELERMNPDDTEEQMIQDWEGTAYYGESKANEDSYYIDDQKQYNGKPYPSQASYIDHEIQGHFRPENYEEAERKTGDGYVYGNWDRIVCNHCGIHLNYDQGIGHLLNSHDTTTNANQAGYTNFYGGSDDNNWSGTFMPSGISGF